MSESTVPAPLLKFNPDTGSITWMVSRGRMKAGDEAGAHDKDGYIRIRVNGKIYPAHRLMWLYVHKEFPKPGMQIDHINGVRDDNRIDNLRLVVSQGNQRNRVVGKNNSSGCLGVRLIPEKWRAVIKVDGKQVSLGMYNEWWDAVCARKSAEYRYGFANNHGKPPPNQRQKLLGLAQK